MSDTCDEPPKKRRRRSGVWKYFEDTDDPCIVKCKVCKTLISRGTKKTTSGMQSHIDSFHSQLSKTSAELDTLPSMEESICRLAVEDGLSFNAIANSSIMKQLFKKADYSNFPSSPNTVKSFVVKFADQKRQVVIDEIKNALLRGEKLTASVDEWTSIRGRRYMNICLHSSSKLFWNLGLIRLKGKIDADACLHYFTTRLNEFSLDITNIYGLVTDGASVMVKFGQLTGLQHQLCFAHALHLAVTQVLYGRVEEEEALEYENNDDEDNFEADEDSAPFIIESEIEAQHLIPTYSALVKKVRKIVAIFRRSPKKDEILQKYVREAKGKEIKLITDCKTRWSSLSDMLSRFQYLHDEVKKALIDIRESITLVDEEVALLKEMQEALEPLKIATEGLSRRDGDLLSADAIFNFVRKKLSELDSDIAKELLHAFLERVGQRRTLASDSFKYLNNNGLACQDDFFKFPGKAAITSFIKSSLVNDNCTQVASEDENTFELSMPISVLTEPECDLQSQMNLFIEKLKAPPPSLPNNRDGILKKEITLMLTGGGKGALLMEAYQNLKSIQPSSVESERAFSAAVKHCTKFRSNLADESLDALVFLKSWFKYMKNKNDGKD